MGLHHEEHGDHSFSDYNLDDNVEDIAQKKKVKRLLDERLERKRLKEECKDDFDEINGEFDWDELNQ